MLKKISISFSQEESLLETIIFERFLRICDKSTNSVKSIERNGKKLTIWYDSISEKKVTKTIFKEPSKFEGIMAYTRSWMRTNKKYNVNSSGILATVVGTYAIGKVPSVLDPNNK